MQTLTDYNACCRVGRFDHTVLDDCPPRTWPRPRPTGRAPSRHGPFYGYALRARA